MFPWDEGRTWPDGPRDYRQRTQDSTKSQGLCDTNSITLRERVCGITLTMEPGRQDLAPWPGLAGAGEPQSSE